jgi:hypothetical protein
MMRDTGQDLSTPHLIPESGAKSILSSRDYSMDTGGEAVCDWITDDHRRR